MSEHRIRLRGGWEWHDPASGEVRRVALPLSWPPGGPPAVRLLRPFHAPPIDPARETLALELAGVAGLRSVRLNDRELARPPAGTPALRVPVDGLLPSRNVLVLEVDAEAARGGEGPGGESPWGEVALVIRPAGGDGAG